MEEPGMGAGSRPRRIAPARAVARVVTGLGLLLVCAGVIWVIYGVRNEQLAAYRLVQAGLILAAVGCCALAALLALWDLARTRVGLEALLGFLTAWLGLSGFFAVGWIEGARSSSGSLFALLISCLLLVGGVALVVVATKTRDKANSWRNRGTRV